MPGREYGLALAIQKYLFVDSPSPQRTAEHRPLHGDYLVLAVRNGSEGEIGRGCREGSKVVGTLQPADKDALLAGLQKNDTPMHFYRMLDEMPGYSGVGLPASAAHRRA